MKWPTSACILVALVSSSGCGSTSTESTPAEEPCPSVTGTTVATTTSAITAMSVDDDTVYWATEAGEIQSMPEGGGPVSTIVSHRMGVDAIFNSRHGQIAWRTRTATGMSLEVLPRTSPSFVVTVENVDPVFIDDSDVYWFSYSHDVARTAHHELRARSLASGAERVVTHLDLTDITSGDASQLAYPIASLFVGKDTIAIVAFDAETAARKIYTVPKSGGETSVLSDFVSDVWADDTTAWFTEPYRGGVQQIALAGGTAKPWGTAQSIGLSYPVSPLRFYSASEGVLNQPACQFTIQATSESGAAGQVAGGYENRIGFAVGPRALFLPNVNEVKRVPR